MSYALRSEAVERELLDRTADNDAGGRLAPTAYLCRKGAVDRLAAWLLLAAGWPIILATMLVVRLTSRGPAVFRQTRVGLHGRIFVMYKIRTMRIDAEAASGPVWTQQNDPRITSVGRWIRRLHLDELPQLINVVKGEMALIGPRPERPEFTQKLALDVPGYLDRLLVLPGVTGLAQINLPPDTNLDSVRRKLILDLAYVREGSLWLDLRIFACTCARLFAVKGPRVTRLFGLQRIAYLPAPAAFDAGTATMATDDESPTVDLVAASLLAKTNGHVHPAANGHNGHAGPWSDEVPAAARRRPR
ncbi:MAG TPA: sugar transferase [Pirellulales bacterium]|nr:sugar transferase [Pirellulales bacterium]